MSDGIEVQSVKASRVEIPTEVHGFEVQIGVGPYPADAPESHRRAVYAILRPCTDHTRAKMRQAGHRFILGQVPLRKDAARIIMGDGNSREAERAMKDALRVAARLAKRVHDSR